MAVKAFVFSARSTDGVSSESGALTTVTLRNTSTPATVYLDAALTTPAANPYVANSIGTCGPLYADDNVDLSFSVTTSNGATTLLQVDMVDGVFSAPYVQIGQLTLFERTATGDGTTTAFELAGVVSSSSYQILVTLDGVLQPVASYTVSSDGTDTTVTFTDGAPPLSSAINFRSATLQALSPASNSLAGSDISATVSQSDGGSLLRITSDRLEDRINVLDYVTPDGTTDNTAMITAAKTVAMATGKPLWFPAQAAAYITDPQTCSSAINIILDPGATVKLKDSATYVESGTTLYVFRLSASNSSVVGGIIDSNKDGQSRAAFNAISGGRFIGIWVVGPLASASRLSNIKINTRVINSGAYGVVTQYCDGVTVDVETDNCGSGVWLFSCTDAEVSRAYLDNLDNDSWKVLPIGLLCTSCDNVTLNNINIPNQSGYDTIASGNSTDDWFTGVGIFDSDNVTGSNWYICAKLDATMTKSVGISLLGLTKSNFSNITIKRYTSVNLEIGALENCDFVNVFGDGEYQRADTTLWPGEAQQGCHVINQGLYSGSSSRVKRPVINCTFTNMQMTRMLSKGLLVYMASDCTWTSCRFNGNQYGVDIRSDNVNDSFPAPETQVTSRLNFIDLEARFNEVVGFWNGGSTDVELLRPNLSNNGQAKNATGNALRLTGTWAFNTSGYFGSNSSPVVARTRARLVAPLTQDDQTVTTAFGSVNPSAPTIVSVERPELYQFGQTININNGATGPADLKVQVLDINNDELTLSAAMTNFPLVAGTGTITTVGTAVTFSSSQAAIITGRMWVKNSTNYRRVIAVASNGLTGTLESAFPSNLTTAAFDIVKTEVEQIRSQDWGINTQSANDNGLEVVSPKWGAGNVFGPFSATGTVIWIDTITVDTIAVLQATTPHDGQVAEVLGRNTAGDLGGGQFRFITGNQSANVTNDPNTGIWVAPSSASSGASGAWKRVLDSYTNVNPYWWASAATAAGLKTGLTRAVTWLSAVYTTSDECGIVFPAGSHSIDGDITIERPRTVIESLDGVVELNFTSSFSTGIVFQVTGAGTSATASDYLVACGLRGGIRIVHSPSASSTAAAGGTTLWFRQCQNVIWDDQVTISSTAFYGVRFSGGQLNDTMNALRISGRYAPPTRRVTASNSGTEVLTSAAHGWTTGWRLVAMDTAAGVTNGSFYYVRVIDADTFTLHTTKANAIANTSAVNITASIAASSPQLRLRRIGSALVRIEEAECASAVYQTPYTLGWESVSPIGDFAGTAINVTGITQANPAVVTAAAHGFSEGQEVRLSSIGGMTEIIGGCYVAMNVTTNTFELQAPDADGAMQNVNSTAYTAYTTGGSATPITRYDFLVDLERADGFWVNRGYWGSCRYAYIHMHREREFGGVYGAHFGKIYADAVDADSTSYRSPLYVEWVPADDFSGTARVLADHDGCQVANLRSQASSYGVKYHNATCLSIKWSDTDFRAIARSAVDISGSGGGAFQFSNCTFASGGVGAGSLIATDDVVNVNGADMLCFMGCEFSAAQSGKARIVLAGTIDNFICHSVFDGTSNDITSSATITNQSVLNASGATSPYNNRLTETLRLSGLTYDGTDTISTFTDWATATPTMSTAVAPSGVPITYTTNTLRWMRHAKKVSFFGNITLSEKGDGSGTVTLVLPSGMPLPNASLATPINIEINTTNGGVLDKDIKGDILANTRTIRIRRGDVAGSTMSPLDYADIIDTTVFRFSGEYETP